MACAYRRQRRRALSGVSCEMVERSSLRRHSIADRAEYPIEADASFLSMLSLSLMMRRDKLDCRRDAMRQYGGLALSVMPKLIFYRHLFGRALSRC